MRVRQFVKWNWILTFHRTALSHANYSELKFHVFTSSSELISYSISISHLDDVNEEFLLTSHTRKFLDLSFEIDIAVPQMCLCRTKGVEFKREMKSPCNDDCHGDVRGVKGCNLMKWNFVTHVRNSNCKNLPYNSTNNSQSIFAEENHPRNDAGSISLDLISMFDRKSTTFFPLNVYILFCCI